ncbi:MAG TPA: amino acid permease [Streptosporangiaceae bacterium]
MLFGLTKRVLVGRPMQSEHLGHTLLPKKIALPVFASDALSSVAYATQEILLVLSLGGIALLHYTPYIGAGVGVLMLVVVASYRQNVHAYPSGGGDYEVATTNLGPKVGLTVASALMVDYTLTVAVSVSAGVANLASAFTGLNSYVTILSVAIVAVIAVMNMRGVRESGTAFAIPTYVFIGVVALLIVWGLTKVALGHPPVSESAHLKVPPVATFGGLGLAFLLLKSFSSGCTALTGVEAISNGVPAFRPPKSKNAASTLAMLGIIAVSMFAGVTALALISHVHLLPDGVQRTVIAQVGRAVFGGSSPLFYLLQFVTALILVLAANTAFNGFPVLASILARDGYLPRQLHNRGDRLAFSNGILLLSGFAILLIVVFNASPTRLIQLYIIGVFVSFVCSQTGMIRHWNRNLKLTTDPRVRRHMKRTRVINSVGAVFTAIVLCIVLSTKFMSGAWIVVVAMPAIWLTMRAISRHYQSVALELAPPQDKPVTLPSSNRAIVLVSKLHLPTLRALAYARATQPSHLEAVTVSVDEAETARLREEWDSRGIPIPLTVVASPYRDITKPVLAYVSRLRRESPRDVVTVFIPEYVLGHWWEQVLHNQSALRLKARLLAQPGVIVASVPYQLRSAAKSMPPLAHPVPHPAEPDPPFTSEAAQAVTARQRREHEHREHGHREHEQQQHEHGLARLRHHVAAAHEQYQAEELQARIAATDATPIARVGDREQATVAGTLRAVTVRPRGSSPSLQADLWDGSGSITLVWLGRREIPGIEPGRHLEVHGRIAQHRGVRTIFNPVYELRPPGGDTSEPAQVNR